VLEMDKTDILLTGDNKSFKGYKGTVVTPTPLLKCYTWHCKHR